MKQYIKIVDKILKHGKRKSNRTGIDSLAISGMMFEHNMQKGFPLLTTKKMGFKSIKVELEGFIKGITDKKWYQERGCHIWDEWCNPKKVPYGHDTMTKQKMMSERDLGPIYGYQWRNFGGPYIGINSSEVFGWGIDQLKNTIEILKKNPNDRRMIVSAWNPKQINEMALPPCHYSFQVLANKETKELDLIWNQRSVDVMLGLPFNIASYGLLLHFFAKEFGFKEGKLIGFLADAHIYKNHIDGAKNQILRAPYHLPRIKTENFKSLFDWTHENTQLENYQYHPAIKFDIAV